MATVGHANTRSCRNAASDGFGATDNQSTDNLVATLVDSDGVSYPDLKPTVKKMGTVATEVIYGPFVTFDRGAEEVTVATGGIHAFTKEAASVPGDIGMGIIPSTTTANTVNTDATGRFVVVARNDTTLWVDLDA